MDPLVKEFLGYVKDAGALGLLVFAMIGGWRKWWVWGWQYDECCTDRTKYRTRSDELESLLMESHQGMMRAQQTHRGMDGC